MATLADLARQYLNQALPDISGIFKPRVDTPVEETPVEETISGVTPQLLRSTGKDNFSVYNPDPNKVRTDYRPYDYRQAMAKSGVGIPSGILSNSEFLYGPKSDLSGLLNFVPFIGPMKRGTEFLKGILDPYLPVNQRSIMENEARGMGILTDDIGRIVQGSGDYDTGANVMAGYNLSQVTPETIQKRRDRILKTISKPGYSGNLQDRLDALDEFEEMMFGTTGVKARTDAIADEKTRAKGKIPLTDQIAMNQAKLDFQKLVDEGEEEQDIIEKIIEAQKTGMIIPGITTATFPGMGLNRRDIIQDIGIQNVRDAINRGRERERQRQIEIEQMAKKKRDIQQYTGGGGNNNSGGGSNYDSSFDYGADTREAQDRRSSDLGFSDIRLKENVELIGKSSSNINIYKFNYKDNPITYQGVMAHEVPWANVKHSNGYMMVDYDKVDVEFKKWQR